MIPGHLGTTAFLDPVACTVPIAASSLPFRRTIQFSQSCSSL